MLVSTKNLKKYFPIAGGVMKRSMKTLRAVDGINLSIKEGETYAIVGESASGKTTLAKTILRIYEPTDGEIWFNGREISKAKGRERKNLRREMQIVYQEISSSLNPKRKAKDIIRDPFDIHKVGDKSSRRERVNELLDKIQLPRECGDKFPSALSGGEKQRIVIARAIALNPKFLVLDEPTSSLDVSVQAKILLLLKELQKELNLTYLLISHDLAVVRSISDRISVMYVGKLMEIAPTNEFFKNPLHPYTRALLSSIPLVTDEELKLVPKKIALKGEVPSSIDIPKGCRFLSRCPEKHKKCEVEEPELVEIRKNHYVRCFSK